MKMIIKISEKSIHLFFIFTSYGCIRNCIILLKLHLLVITFNSQEESFTLPKQTQRPKVRNKASKDIGGAAGTHSFFCVEIISHQKI